MYWNSQLQSGGSRRMLNHWQSGRNDGKGRYILDPMYKYELPKGPILIGGSSADAATVAQYNGKTYYNINPRGHVICGAFFLDDIKSYDGTKEQYRLPNIFIMPPELKYPIQLGEKDGYGDATITNADGPYILQPIKGGEISWMYATKVLTGDGTGPDASSLAMAYEDNPDKIFSTICRDKSMRIEWHEQYRKVMPPKYIGNGSLNTAPKKVDGYCRLYVSVIFIARLIDRFDGERFHGKFKEIRGWYYVKQSESSLEELYSKSIDGTITATYTTYSSGMGHEHVGAAPWKYGGRMCAVTDFRLDAS